MFDFRSVMGFYVRIDLGGVGGLQGNPGGSIVATIIDVSYYVKNEPSARDGQVCVMNIEDTKARMPQMI